MNPNIKSQFRQCACDSLSTAIPLSLDFFALSILLSAIFSYFFRSFLFFSYHTQSGSLTNDFLNAGQKAPHGKERSGWGLKLPYCYISSFTLLFFFFSNFAFFSVYVYRLFFVLFFPKVIFHRFRSPAPSAQGAARECQNLQQKNC